MRKRLARMLCMFMCLVLVMGNTPTLSTCVRDAHAEESISVSNAQELSDSQGTLDSTSSDATADQATTSDQTNGQESPSQSGIPLEVLVVPTYSSGSLRATHISSDGAYYNLTLEYDELAAIPEGAELQLSEPSARGLRPSFEQALNLQTEDRVLEDAYLTLQITADGQVIEPAAPVDIYLETNAFASEQAASIEAALLVPGEAATEHIIPRKLGKRGSDPKLSMCVEHLGTLALGTVVGSIESWQQADLDVFLLGPRYGLSVELNEVDAPQLEEGIEARACVQINVSSSSAAEASFWVEATPRRGATGTPDELGGSLAFGVANGSVQRTLFDAEGTSSPVAFNSNAEQLLIVWDSGYRKLSLNMSEVSVEGMAPEGTSGSASDVAAEYSYPEGVIPVKAQQTKPHDGLPAKAAIEYETLAAYDIKLRADGQEYQPDEEHPLTVTITNADISPKKALQLWHIQDDGTTTQVENVEFTQGTAVFEATGFSTYLLTATSDTSAQTLSTNFTLRATASTYKRSSTVTFVDQNKNPINSTVSGTYTISYTGVADTSNETNTVDLYSFADKIDPAIADEYEFSRVYLHLKAGKGDQKDFRYVQVGDESNIVDGGDVELYRAYIHMNSISENRANQDYNGTWYQLSLGSNMDPIFIEYYHVAEASFYALDERDNPVKGAVFALYTDSECHQPLEYQGEMVSATSDRKGLVDFGKIPRGDYYMKETTIPDGFKKTTKVYSITVDGESTLPNVIHKDDDGSIIVSDVYEMTVTNEDHENATVVVTVYCDDEVYKEFELNEACNWTYELTGLDPNKSYVISETAIRDSSGTDVMQDWAPEISTEIDPEKTHIKYYRSDAFQKGKEYVLVINPGTSDSKALTGGSSLSPVYLTTSDEAITGEVSDTMLWYVTKVSADGVITLQNSGTDKYLDQADGKKWFQNSEEPLFVRHTNDDGTINIYYRRNLNITTAYYLYMINRVDRTTKASDAADFAIYGKYSQYSANVSITNKPTTYPVMIENIVYPSNEPLANMTYRLYEADASDESALGELRYDNLLADSDGFLMQSGTKTFDLEAGSYFLVQQSQGDDGFEPLYASPEQPLSFTVTRKGKIGIKGTYAIPDFTYASTLTKDEVEYPLLRVPHFKPAAVELQLIISGTLSDLTKEFEFTIQIPEGVNEIVASIDGKEISFYDSNNSFTLKNGQILRMENIPLSEQYTFTQAESNYAMQVEAVDASKVNVTTAQAGDKSFTLSNLTGTKTAPGQVRIINSLSSNEVAVTGIDDNTNAWATGALVSLAALIGAFFFRRQRSS